MTYAEELVSRGYGLPLWFPEPTTHALAREVLVGDVGFISEGRFYALFNTMRGADDPLNREGVPDDFVPLRINQNTFLARQADFLPAGPISSTSISRVE